MAEQVALGETPEAAAARRKTRPGLDADEVYRRLAARHEFPEWLFFREVPFDGETSGTMRLADAVALPTYQSRGYVLDGFEVKVTRSDWLRELKEGAKADAIAKHVDRFWLVLGDGSIAIDEEVPPAWGILVPHGDDGLRARRPAKMLREVRRPWPRDLLVTLARKAYKNARDHHEASSRAAFDRGYESGLEAGKREAGNAPAKAEAYDAIAEVLGFNRYHVGTREDAERIAAQAKVGRLVLEGGWPSLRDLPRELEREADGLRRLAEHLRKAATPPEAPA